VSPRKSRKKSLCFSTTIVSTPARARSRPQHHSGGSAAHDAAPAEADLRGLVHRASPIKARLEQGFQKVAEIWDHARGASDKIKQASKTGDISCATVYDLVMRQNWHKAYVTKQI
jgi:hypothetical protein